MGDVLGEPRWSGANSRGETEQRWQDLTVRWDLDSRRVADIDGPTDQSITIDGRQLLPNPDPVSVLLGLDPNPVLCLGFLLFRGIGVAVTGFHDGDEEQKSITVFAEGRWDDCSTHFEPFVGSD